MREKYPDNNYLQVRIFLLYFKYTNKRGYMIDLNMKVVEVMLNCKAIKKMREDRNTKVLDLDNLYESTVNTIISITPDIILNKWLDNMLEDKLVMPSMAVDRHYAETFIENIINQPG